MDVVRTSKYTQNKWELRKMFSRRIEREEATLDI